ncbi:MAG: ATP synthase F1 subunit gamma [Acidimicrobiales bacterium]|jgi:F-type H+-transporting ATPase subunit gamma
MAGGQERVLRRRIRSVESTKKITRSFELIAASQIARAQGRIAGSRPYIKAVSDILAETAGESTSLTRLVGECESRQHVLVLVIVADRGLAGAYNSNVLRAAERAIRSGADAGQSYTVVAIGKKAAPFFRFRHQPVEHQFLQMSDRPSFEDARRVAAVVVPTVVAGEIDVVQVISTRVRSLGTQVVETRQLFPILPADAQPAEATADASPETASANAGAEPGTGDHGAPAPDAKLGYFEFEPDPEQLLTELIWQYAEAAIYGALLEASAAEHASRQRAMAAATENAEELLKTITRVMNRARQDSITTEIMEIVGGAEALRPTGDDTREFAHPQATEEQST